jgi:Sec-independent protein translocase protein TatA
MTSVGSIELLLIILIAVIVIGPKNTQSIVRTVGKVIRVFRKSIEDLKNEAVPKEELESLKKDIGDAGEMPLLEELKEIKMEVSGLKNDVRKSMTISKIRNQTKT